MKLTRILASSTWILTLRKHIATNNNQKPADSLQEILGASEKESLKAATEVLYPIELASNDRITPKTSGDP